MFKLKIGLGASKAQNAIVYVITLRYLEFDVSKPLFISLYLLFQASLLSLALLLEIV